MLLHLPDILNDFLLPPLTQFTRQPTAIDIQLIQFNLYLLDSFCQYKDDNDSGWQLVKTTHESDLPAVLYCSSETFVHCLTFIMNLREQDEKHGVRLQDWEAALNYIDKFTLIILYGQTAVPSQFRTLQQYFETSLTDFGKVALAIIPVYLCPNAICRLGNTAIMVSSNQTQTITSSCSIFPHHRRIKWDIRGRHCRVQCPATNRGLAMLIQGMQTIHWTDWHAVSAPNSMGIQSALTVEASYWERNLERWIRACFTPGILTKCIQRIPQASKSLSPQTLRLFRLLSSLARRTILHRQINVAYHIAIIKTSRLVFMLLIHFTYWTNPRHLFVCRNAVLFRGFVYSTTFETQAKSYRGKGEQQARSVLPV